MLRPNFIKLKLRVFFTKAQLRIHKCFDFVSKFCFNITLVNLKDILFYVLNFKIVIDFKGKFSTVISNQL